MNNLVHQYFAIYRKAPIIGLGTFRLEVIASNDEFALKQIFATRERVEFSCKIDPILEGNFLDFAQSKNLISKSDVIAYFDKVRETLNNSNVFNILGFGELRKGTGFENYQFTPRLDYEKFRPAVSTSRVLHNDAEHEMKVGEQIYTNTEMKAFLSDKKPKDYWWIYALILLVAAIGAIFYYLYF